MFDKQAAASLLVKVGEICDYALPILPYLIYGNALLLCAVGFAGFKMVFIIL
jgi:hypothetical protein